MKRIIEIICLAIFSSITLISIGQNELNTNHSANDKILNVNQYYIGSRRDVVTDGGIFFDSGGEKGELRNEYAITTFHATCNLLEIYFTEFHIPDGAQIRIYKGNTVNDELFGTFSNGEKPYNVVSKDITIEYIPTYFMVSPASGWEGVIKTRLQSIVADKVTQPESDCIYAIPLCQNQTVIVSNSQYTDTGAENDDSGDCYSGTGSGGSVWFSFSPQATGPLDFSIAPSGSTDYDFVLWDITNGCASKTQILCNYEATHGTTGANSSGTGTSLGSSGGLWCSRPTVTVGHTYALCINFYAGSNDGYVLTFQNEASSVAITDNSIPTIENAFANVCGGASTFTIYFSEWVQCSTIQNSDFTLAGYAFTVTNSFCINGRTDHVEISVSPAMPLGTYSIHVQDILDMCGNNMNSNYNIVLGSVPTANAGPDMLTCRTPGIFGTWNYTPTSQTLTAIGGSAYLWSTGGSTASISVSPTTTTTYTVTVANGSCVATDNVTVVVSNSPTPNIGADQTICQGASFNLSASGGTAYQWQSTTSTNFFGSPTGWANISGATNSNYTATPSGTTTTYYQVLVTAANGCTGTDYMKATIDPISSNAGPDQTACAAGTTINLAGTNTNGTSFSWNVGSPTGTQIATTANTTVTPAVTTTYYFTATSATGCVFSDAMTVNLANYGAITSYNGGGCVPSSLTFTTLPAVSGALSYTFTWYQMSGNPGSCPTSPSGMNQMMQETVLSTYDTTILPLQTFDALATSSIGAGLGGWNEVTQTASVNNWAVGSTAPIAVKSLCIKNATTYNAYTNNDDCEKIAYYSTLLNASNCDNIRISFDWKCVGQRESGLFGCISPSVVNNDHGHLVYALNNPTNPASWIEIGGPYWNQSATQNVVDLVLPATLNGQSFYIGFKWYNDGVAGGCTSVNPFMIDNVTLKVTKHRTPTSTYLPAPLTPPAVNTYVCYVTPIGGTCNNISNMAANCYTITCPDPLPIELLSFEGTCNAKKLIFNWATASEQNNDYYTIDGSNDGVDFNKIAIIKGAGNSNSVNEYSYILEGNFFKFYRLKQTDFDGKFSYSEIISLSCNSNSRFNNISVFPNPASNNLTLNFGIEINTKLHLTIKDMLGRTTKEILYDAKEISFMNISLEDLNKGIYFLQIEDLTNNRTASLLKFIKD